VEGACYSFVSPARVKQPQLIAYSKEMARQIGFSEKLCQSDLFTQVFSGNHVLEGMQPYAMCYGGHQFGHWAGQLGDGRAINLGEVLNRAGQRFTLQLKGAGPTPYSRGADGLAVLRSSMREFLCSEAMHHLGVPTTRALSLALTGEQVVRDMFYDGNPETEPGAIVCRVAPSFTRFGNFQLLAFNDKLDELQQLLDFTIRSDFPDLGEPCRDVYLAWFEEVCRLTAEMIVHWQRVGFVHGVMNTDNMSILGLTIDYGPYGWLENYDPDWTPNTTDAQGRRYRYGHQPEIALWNLVQLANAIYPLIEDIEALKISLQVYSRSFRQGWQDTMAQKLGLCEFEESTDEELIKELLTLMEMVETDMTIFYRQLAQVNTAREDGLEVNNDALLAPLMPAYYVEEQITVDYKNQMGNWLQKYIQRMRQDNRSDDERRIAMNKVNPRYVLRNYLAQLAIDKSEQGDHSMVQELLEMLRHPYDERPEMEKYYAKRPDWARQRAGCSMLSCSS
jgi:uncharacterized protein YdiU (UPF0061 family)